jgi:predicted nuclease of predicted toxin-antitoxin system
MTIWVDAHLSPAIATWIASTFGVEAIALRDLGLRDAEDHEIFERLVEIVIDIQDYMGAGRLFIL